jgi:glycolate oxidase iron-sulfur subunit
VAWLPPRLPARTEAIGERRGAVALLAGCVMHAMFAPVHEATIRVLAANGFDVLVPRGQGCCGALHAHTGEAEGARKRGRALIRTLGHLEVDAIVTNSAGCGAMLKEYADELTPAERPAAEAFGKKVRDVAEFLVERGVREPAGAIEQTVTYHDACHLAHAQKVRSQPRQLLSAIPGLRLVELPESDNCCGSAGIYNLLQPRLAARLRERKVDAILATGAEIVAMGNPGCHAWIAAGVRARGGSVEVLHTMQLLDRAYRTGLHGASERVWSCGSPSSPQ